MSVTQVDLDRISPHFHRREIACPCCDSLPFMANARTLCLHLERVRAHYGAMVLSSAHRCANWNRLCGGVPRSLHLNALAADILVARDSDRYRLVALLRTHGFRGIGVAPWFVHADLRTGGLPVMWVYPARG